MLASRGYKARLLHERQFVWPLSEDTCDWSVVWPFASSGSEYSTVHSKLSDLSMEEVREIEENQTKPILLQVVVFIFQV